MSAQNTDVVPVRRRDMFAITKMTFANMVGADQHFTRITRNPLGWWYTYLSLPVYLSLTGHGYKAIRGGRVIGCAFLHLRHSSAYVYNVNVNQPFRRQGVARHLMNHLESETMAQGRTWMALQVDNGNRPAQQLYERLGYRPYHPHFLRFEGSVSIPDVATTGLVIEPLAFFRGRRLFSRYSNIEQQAGDLWATPALDDFDLRPSSGGSYWRCRLNDDEIGCARVTGTNGRLRIDLPCKPAYWGHMTTGDLIELLLDAVRTASTSVDVYLGSGGHHEAAARQLNDLGFETRTVRRILMLKPLHT